MYWFHYILVIDYTNLYGCKFVQKGLLKLKAVNVNKLHKNKCKMCISFHNNSLFNIPNYPRVSSCQTCWCTWITNFTNASMPPHSLACFLIICTGLEVQFGDYSSVFLRMPGVNFHFERLALIPRFFTALHFQGQNSSYFFFPAVTKYMCSRKSINSTFQFWKIVLLVNVVISFGMLCTLTC